MDIVDWLSDVLDVEETPDLVDLEGVKTALAELRERTREDEFPEEGEGPDLLREMSAVLSDLCDDLEAFVASGDFDNVRSALNRGHDLVSLRELLYHTLENPAEMEMLVA